MIQIWRIGVLAALATSACSAPERGTLRPSLAFRVAGDSTFRNARDLAVDGGGNVFIFDYDNYGIRRFDSTGTLLATFGGSGNAPGRFEHLMAIRAHGDSLLALDAGALSVFDLSGNHRARRALADTITCDLPSVLPDGRWAASCVVQATAEQVLTLRRADGREERRPASYALSEIFPGVVPGAPFWVNSTQARSYVYDFTPAGRLVWAVSDRLRVFVDQNGADDTLFAADATAEPFPADQRAALAARRARIPPPFFLNVPDDYQLIQHLLVAEDGEIWLYLRSRERTGMLRLSPSGRELGFYTLDTEFDPLTARLAAANGRLYFLVQGRDETAVYWTTVP